MTGSGTPGRGIRIARGLLRRLARAGIRIEPHFMVVEGEQSVELPAADERLSFAMLSAAEAGEIAQLSDEFGPGRIRERLEQGKLCFGARFEGRLVGKTWCDLDEFNYPPERRRLDDDEAYLYAAAALPEYRGQNIAPLMRYACYDALRAMGRTRFCSYTEYFNAPARRFKQKLGAREESLRVYVELFGKLKKTFTLRRYDGSPRRRDFASRAGMSAKNRSQPRR